MRPSVASLLLRRMGGVWTPVTRQPVLSTLCWSIDSTTVTEESGTGAQRRVRSKRGEDSVGVGLWRRRRRRRIKREECKKGAKGEGSIEVGMRQ